MPPNIFISLQSSPFFWSVDSRHRLSSKIALNIEHPENLNSAFVDHSILILQH